MDFNDRREENKRIVEKNKEGFVFVSLGASTRREKAAFAGMQEVHVGCRRGKTWRMR